jgi:flagellar hook-associated protein 2
MATQSTSSTGVTRVTGTYSGLDVDSLVKAGLTSDQSKLDKAKQSEQIMEWRQEQYRTVMSDVTNFTNKYLTSSGEKSLMLSTDWNAMKATSDNAAVTVTASTDAPEANYTVNVNQLATAASTTINATNVNFTNGTSITVKDEAGLTKTITLTGKTQQEIAKNLNSSLSAAGVKVSAKYSDFTNSGNGGMVLESQTLGAKTNFSVVLGTGAVDTNSDGHNANVTIKDSVSGQPKTYTGNSNEVTYNNTTFKFKYTTTTDYGNVATEKQNPVTISTTKDVSTVADKITSFVDDYNTLMKEINGKIYETYSKSYAPLTDEQRKAMSDSEITKWETKAKTGLLRKDDYLTNLASDMKETMTSMMKGSGFNLEKLGIEPVQDYGAGNGTYTVKDKSKLTSALQNNFDKVYELFNSVSSDSTATKSTSTDGILSKLKVALYNNVTKPDSKMAKKAGVDASSTSLNNEMTKAMKDQQTLIDTLEDKLKDKETSLYNKYSTLETKLSSLDSSSSNLTSMLG